MKRRVVVTGCGALTAAGNTLDGLWQALLSGRTLVGKVTNFACPELDSLSGAELVVPESYDLPASINGDAFRARCCHIALAAARQALVHANLPVQPEGGWGEGAGLVLGTTMGEERQVGDLISEWTDGERVAEAFSVVPFDLPRGCAATYFPEANGLVPLDSVADRSHTPTSKSVVIRIRSRSAP